MVSAEICQIQSSHTVRISTEISASKRMRCRLPSITLHAGLFLPSLIMTAFSQSSMTAGLTIYLLLLFSYFIFDMSRSFFNIKQRFVLYDMLLLLGLILFTFSHAMVPMFSTTHFNQNRFWGSYALLAFMALNAWLFSYKISRINESTLVVWVDRAIWFLVINALLGLTGVSLFPQMTHKPVGIFSEPSHLALVLSPLLLYSCIKKSRPHLFFIAFFFSWSFLIENLTTLLVVLMSFSFIFRLRLSVLILLTAIATGLVSLDLEYFISRFTITGDVENISVLVLQQGWDTAISLMSATNNWGSGFQQFGFLDVTSEISNKINLLSGNDLNKFDGGTTASKLVGEFGFFAVTFLIFYFAFFIWAFLRLKRVATRQMNRPNNFFIICLFSLSIELFVRGIGYFSPGCFLALSAFFSFFNTPNHQKIIIND